MNRSRVRQPPFTPPPGIHPLAIHPPPVFTPSLFTPSLYSNPRHSPPVIHYLGIRTLAIHSHAIHALVIHTLPAPFPAGEGVERDLFRGLNGGKEGTREAGQGIADGNCTPCCGPGVYKGESVLVRVWVWDGVEYASVVVW